MRVLACVAIIVFHVTLLGEDHTHFPLSVWYPGMSGVDLFFVLSGFVMLQSADRLAGRAAAWKKFLINRLIRIVPMYWLFTVLFLGIGAGLSHTALHRSYFLRWIVGSFLFWPTPRYPGDSIVSICPVGWTLIFEMLFYFVVAAALAAGSGVLLTGSVVMVLLAALSHLSTPAWGNIAFFFNPIVLEFAMGMVVYRLHSRGHDLPRWVAWPLLMASIAVLSTVYVPAWRYLVSGLLACAVVASMVAVEDSFRKTPALLLVLADATYVLYLWHSGAINLVLRFVVPHFPQVSVLVVSCLALSLAGGVALHAWIERPVQRWLANRYAPRQERQVAMHATAAGAEG